ncbi:bifunctional adenosylcobinamide kinase/adenosylcobinamide-phosphate guanylyltransferase [Ruegeria sp. SCSIO 43209]|uniref:bifunctional adenosylcobinamide kinase/adenosylcobinamide-phosphate guanylyltransferase n=1 Tax=Ruegeria sp. SCSIO 43209 TaxID=2793010 RepID=UPI001CAA4110|nr:bifunctional adenosylcobinamide kinase/adenosylcobinamide-phosphate guanylyltransferase [Ruegeria sp. SCSIO 43209]UAB90819.1 bifunctional adenosylcobinamide kinase/adenosylcobinamide-phosphate guanylyltransferase [Ruegeria sp. SCSIO 43209]
MHADLTFILGGAASGKSAFAEQLAVSTGKSRVYLATSQVFDDEMRLKIRQHIAQRGSGWTTIEAPFDLSPELAKLTNDQICLIDCATMWLTNHLLAENNLEEAQAGLLEAMKTCTAQIVVVSNEVGHGIVPDNALSRRFREAQGRLNIALAAQADRVVQVTAGLPLVLKGQPL